jgi:hypothetical protein
MLLFDLKCVVLALPFVLIGAMSAPFVPKIGAGASYAAAFVSFMFGYIVMVIAADEDDPLVSIWWERLLKLVYLAVSSFAIACLINLGDQYRSLDRIAVIPLSFVSAKIFFRTQLTEFLS